MFITDALLGVGLSAMSAPSPAGLTRQRAKIGIDLLKFPPKRLPFPCPLLPLF